MPKYTVNDPVTGQKFQVEWSGAEPPTQDEVKGIIDQKRHEYVKGIKEEPTTKRRIMDIVGGITAPFTGWPGRGFNLLARGSMEAMGEPYDPEKRVPGISDIFGYETSKVPARDLTNVPSWQARGVAPAVDVVSGALDLAAPAFPFAYGLKALLPMAVGTAAGMGAEKIATSVGVPEIPAEAIGLATGLGVGGAGLRSQARATTKATSAKSEVAPTTEVGFPRRVPQPGRPLGTTISSIYEPGRPPVGLQNALPRPVGATAPPVGTTTPPVPPTLEMTHVPGGGYTRVPPVPPPFLPTELPPGRPTPFLPPAGPVRAFPSGGIPMPPVTPPSTAIPMPPVGGGFQRYPLSPDQLQIPSQGAAPVVPRPVPPVATAPTVTPPVAPPTARVVPPPVATAPVVPIVKPVAPTPAVSPVKPSAPPVSDIAARALSRIGKKAAPAITPEVLPPVKSRSIYKTLVETAPPRKLEGIETDVRPYANLGEGWTFDPGAHTGVEPNWFLGDNPDTSTGAVFEVSHNEGRLIGRSTFKATVIPDEATGAVELGEFDTPGDAAKAVENYVKKTVTVKPETTPPKELSVAEKALARIKKTEPVKSEAPTITPEVKSTPVKAEVPKPEVPAKVEPAQVEAPKAEVTTTVEPGDLVKGQAGMYQVTKVEPDKITYDFTNKAGKTTTASMAPQEFVRLQRGTGYQRSEPPKGPEAKPGKSEEETYREAVEKRREKGQTPSEKIAELEMKAIHLRDAGEMRKMEAVENEIKKLRKELGKAPSKVLPSVAAPKPTAETKTLPTVAPPKPSGIVPTKTYTRTVAKGGPGYNNKVGDLVKGSDDTTFQVISREYQPDGKVTFKYKKFEVERQERPKPVRPPGKEGERGSLPMGDLYETVTGFLKKSREFFREERGEFTPREMKQFIKEKLEKTGDDPLNIEQAKLLGMKISHLQDKHMRGEAMTPGEKRDFELFKDDIMSFNNPTGKISKFIEGVKGFLSQDQYLDEHSMTRHIPDAARRAEYQGSKWMVDNLDRINTIRGRVLSQEQNNDLVAYLNGNKEGVPPKTAAKGDQIRDILDEVWDFATDMGAVSKKGKPVGYLDDYFTHIIKHESFPAELRSAVMDSLRNLFENQSLKGGVKEFLFKEERAKPTSKEEIGPGIYGKGGAGEPFVPYAEMRRGTLKRLETDFDKIINEYLRMFRILIFDKPAIEEMNTVLQRIPRDHPARGSAEYYVKNWARQEIMDGGARWFKAIDRKLYDIGAASALAFSQRLQLLHLGRILSQGAPEIDVYIPGGLAHIAKDPVESFKYTRSMGLFGTNARLPQLKTGGTVGIGAAQPAQNIRNLMNLMNVGNLAARWINHASNIYKYKTYLKDPDWEYKAYKDTMRQEGMGGRVSPIRFMDNPWFPESVISFKRWAVKLTENWLHALGETAREPNAQNIARIGKYLMYSTVLYYLGHAIDVGLFHYGKNVLAAPGPSARQIARAGGYAIDGDFDKALAELAKLYPMGLRKELIDVPAPEKGRPASAEMPRVAAPRGY